MAIDLQVFPVRTFHDTQKGKWQKVPAIPKGEDWKSYKAEPHVIAHASNVGVVIPEGRVVIDLDVYKGITRQVVDTVLGVALDWESAQLQRTVSGGEHYCFALPTGATVPQGSNLLGVDGFDTRCAGRGWICTGEGYTDLTMLGMPGAIADEDFPEMPIAAVERLNSGMVVSDGAGVSDLEQAISHQPLDDLTLEQMWHYLQKLPQDDLEAYDPWAKTGMAISHQTGGSNDGFKLWVKWSKGSSHFDIEECRKKWPSFSKRDHIAKPTRFDYVIHRAGGRQAIAADLAESWATKGADVTNADEYEAIKAKLRKVSLATLAKDQRQRIAKEIFDSYGKDVGITKSAIVEAIMPPKSKGPVLVDEGDRPDWVNEWVYVEETCEFASTKLNYAIKREAFNAKFDRREDVIASEKPASVYALVDCQIPTVVNRIFWPGADLIIEYQGKPMLNIYRKQGVPPAESLDDEGQAVVDRLLKHIAFTLEDEREQTIMLDWLTFVYQNPGQRVNWALLLQGAQGTGKSYFAVMLQALMGELVTNLDPAAIAGRFTSWAFGSLVIVVEEVRISGQNKFEVMDRTKPFISNPTIQIEEKGRDHRTVPNFTSYFMLTNHKDALPLAAGDRRYCVMFSRVQSEDQLYKELGGKAGAEAYFDALFGDLEARPDAVAHFFANRQISEHFSPRGRAPDTRAKQMMMDVGTSPDRLALEDAINQHACAVVADRLIDVTWLNALCVADGVELPKTRTLSAILLEMGYEQIDGKRVRIQQTGKLHYVWYRPDMIESKDARDAVKQFHDDPDFVPF